jgi:hypothetical protein
VNLAKDYLENKLQAIIFEEKLTEIAMNSGMLPTHSRNPNFF